MAAVSERLRDVSFTEVIVAVSLFILSIPLTHGGGLGLVSPVSAVIWIVICTGCSARFLTILRSERITMSSRDTPLLLAVLLFATCTVWREHFDLSLLLVLSASILIFVATRQIPPQQLSNFLVVLLGGAGLQSIYAWLLFMGMFDFLGLRSPVLTGGFLQPNVLASFLATALAAAGVLLAGTEEARSQKLYIGLYIAIFVLIVTLLTIASRTGWVATALVIALSLIWLKNNKRAQYIIVVIVAIVTELALQSLFPEINQRIDDKLSLSGPRYEIWSTTLSMIREQPLLGFGSNIFSRKYVEAAANLSTTWSAVGLEHPHNFILNWWFTGGFGAVIAIAIFAIWFFYALSKITTREQLFFSALLIPILLHTQTEFPFHLSPLHLFLVIVFLAHLSSTAFPNSTTINLPSQFKAPLGSVTLATTAIASALLTLEAWNTLHIYRATKLPDTHAFELNKVVYPIASFESHQDALAIISMQRARKSGDPLYYSHVEAWAEQKVLLTPWPQIYSALIEAKIALNDQEGAKRYYKEMTYYFPDSKTLFEIRMVNQ